MCHIMVVFFLIIIIKSVIVIGSDVGAACKFLESLEGLLFDEFVAFEKFFVGIKDFVTVFGYLFDVLHIFMLYVGISALNALDRL